MVGGGWAGLGQVSFGATESLDVGPFPQVTSDPPATFTGGSRIAAPRTQEIIVAIDIGLIKVVIRGTLVSVQDWSTAFWIGLDGGSAPTTSTSASIADAIEAKVATMIGQLTGHIWSTETHYTGISIYYYPPDTLTAEWTADNSDGAAAGTLTSYEPTFLAQVVSLLSPFSGASNRGRMYVPFTANGIGSDGEWGSADITYAGANVASMMTAINALDLTTDGITGQACVVVSRTRAWTKPITQTRTDSIPDVQRRRKDKLGPTHVVTTGV